MRSEGYYIINEQNKGLELFPKVHKTQANKDLKINVIYFKNSELLLLSVIWIVAVVYTLKGMHKV